MRKLWLAALSSSAIFTAAFRAEAQVTLTNSTSPIKARAVVEMSSASIQRGYTLTQGPTLQPSLWLFSDYGLGAGVWGSMSLEDRSGENVVFYEQEAGAFQKVDLFLYYKVPLPEVVKLELLYAQYIYPQDNLLPDPTIRDSIVKFTLPGFLNPFVMAAYGLSAPLERDLYVETGVQQLVFQQGPHAISAAALTTYRNPDEPTPTKKAGLGHSQATLAYGYEGLKVAANYIVQGQKEVMDITKATEFTSTVGYTAWF